MWQERKINFFEKVLVIVGLLAILIGYLLIHNLVGAEGISIGSLQVIFLWCILILLIVIAAINENMKEELKIVVENQSKEMRLLRDDLRRN